MHLYRYSLLLLLLGLLTTCKREKVAPQDQLPPATTSGANTWGCLVNGEVWTANGRDHVRGDWTLPSSCYWVMGFSKKLDNQTVYPSVALGIRDRFATGSYDIKADSTGAWATLWAEYKKYRSDHVLNGRLTLTRLDRSAGIASGTFEFTMVAPPGDTVKVTQGRFDIGHMDL